MRLDDMIGRVTAGSILAALFLLAGCSGPVSPHSPEGAKLTPTYALPADYKQLVVNHMRQTLKDPYSMRDVQISAPRLHQAVVGTLWSVCVLGNGKNSYGAYIGMKPMFIVFGDSKVSMSDEEYAVMTCSEAKYEPFVEYVAQMQSGETFQSPQTKL